MNSVATTPENYHQEIIRLQLKKPKNWNWQLSTSKSSPHILLPIIQLYNSKGILLIETKDDGVNQRRSWHSNDIEINETRCRNVNKKLDEKSRHLQRCKSDNLSSIQKRNETTIQHSTTVCNDNKSNKKSRSRSSDNVIRLNDRRKLRINHHNNERLQKSQSDILDVGNLNLTESGSTNSTRTTTTERLQRHRRSRSDDLFRRKLKYNEESLKRAEIDGYKNFIKTNIPQNVDNNIINDNSKEDQHHHHQELDKETDLANLCYGRYKTRTSSAGTLIIPEECFNNNHRRRRRRQQLSPGKTTSKNVEISQIYKNNGMRQISDPLNGKTRSNTSRFINTSDIDDDDDDRSKLSPNKTHPVGLFCSHSDIFPFAKLQHSTNNSKNNDTKTITMDTIDKNEKSLKKKHRKKKQRPVDSNGSTSVPHRLLYGEKPSKFQHNERTGNCERRIKAPIVENKTVDTDLLQLVRRLADNNNNNNNNSNNNITTDHDVVKMGANVSRHSSKGLSGRRSQSSGSICNGKGRHENGKMCGSLPSYLDDHNSTTGSSCNNNHHHHHDCEKSTLDDEVQRIPPLGDGAPLHWKFSDNQTALCDQGYGSERSPEEEYPPPLPDHDNSQCHHHLEPHACYPFITPESTFTVKLTKSSRGLGLSVTGGIDSGGSWPGLIRIKRLFPHQPASACGLLNVGDLIIEANGITLTGLTNYEALEVLRTASNQVELKVCRPPPDVLSCVSPISEVPPPPPRREPPTTLNLSSSGIYCTPEDDYYHGEFEIKLTKIQGSLGFTLRKEDDSALGHYVRALVREPALTDGRIRAGDKIIAVNDVEISPMSHEQAVKFLRQCGDIVKLRLYRDSAQTPIAALSPTETTPRTSFSKKAHLRQEAVDMLNDIAVRKLIPNNQDIDPKLSPPSSTTSSSVTTIASPRRLRRSQCSSDTDNSTKYLITDEQFHEGLLQKCQQYDDDNDDYNLFSIESNDDGDDNNDKQLSRPNSLDLYNPNQTPIVTRKPRFNFSIAHNAYELNNLDADVLDAPNLQYILNNGDDVVQSTVAECGDSFPKEPASMPHIPINNGDDNNKQGFSYKNPVYQSAHPQFNDNSQQNKENKEPQQTTKQVDLTQKLPMQNEEEILAIELNRGWNSRLGFSLQGAAGVTYVSAVHADSVAARDGRLKPGDRIIKVNDESVENMKTNEIIDLLRIVRGPVCIVVSRIRTKEDCLKSNAEN